jgi:serine/threonine-protein kinase RsbW
VTIVQVPSKPASAALVRRRLAAELLSAQLSREVVEDAVLIASELVTNAIRHAAPLPDGKLTVAWDVEGPEVIVKVTDGGGAGRPRVRHPAPEEVSGRGLSLVEALASRWGVEDTAGATTVWASLIA